MNQPDADETIDYNYAQQELMMKEYSNDPISEAISAVEQQYEEDKQGRHIVRVMMKEYSNDPISEAISAVEQQYEEDKQGRYIVG